MSVIHLDPKELATIRNLFLANRRTGSEHKTIDKMLQTLIDCNAKTYLERYPREGAVISWTIEELMPYFKLGMDKKEQIEAIDSFRSLIYNCDSNLSGDAQIAYRYLSGILLMWMTSKLELAWGLK